MKGCENRNFYTKSEEKVISMIIKFTEEKLEDLELDVLVKIMNSMNLIRLTKATKAIEYGILNKFIKHVANNIQELQINGVFNVLAFKCELEDDAYR
jgi:hypothetical protein